MSSPSEQTLLVTGANGFVAGHIIKVALEKGYKVKGAVRTDSSAAQLKATFPSYSSQLSTTIVPDITKVESFKDAFGPDVTGVIHTASPFVFDIKDTRVDLLDPAINGATTILEAAARYGADSIRRVVTTASFASNLDLLAGKRPNYTYTEQDWNPMTYDEATTADPTAAYCASKALAERAQWDWMAANAPTFDLVALCPAWIFGPHVAPPSRGLSGLNQSSAALWRMVDKDGLPGMDFMGFVDVRDNALAHVAAFETPEAGGERFILAQHFDYQSVADAVRESIPELSHRIPVGTPGAGWQELENGAVYSIDTSKAQGILGVKYIPFGVSMKDSFLELLEAERMTT